MHGSCAHRSGGCLLDTASRNHETTYQARPDLAGATWRLRTDVVSSLHTARCTAAVRTEMDKFGADLDGRTDSSGSSRFTSQAATAEDLLKAQTVGLVNLNDYRKRRAEALDRTERGESAASSGASTPVNGYGISLTRIVGAS